MRWGMLLLLIVLVIWVMNLQAAVSKMQSTSNDIDATTAHIDTILTNGRDNAGRGIVLHCRTTALPTDATSDDIRGLLDSIDCSSN